MKTRELGLIQKEFGGEMKTTTKILILNKPNTQFCKAKRKKFYFLGSFVDCLF